jgi:hypothetical protein
MPTLSVKILNPQARSILDGLASVGLIEVVPHTSAISEVSKDESNAYHESAVNDAMLEADRRYAETSRRLAE